MIKESKWSKKYKDSIDCNNPKGFSQRAHCQGLKKKKRSKKASIIILKKISKIIDVLEKTGYLKEANDLHHAFIKVAKKFSPPAKFLRKTNALSIRNKTNKI